VDTCQVLVERGVPASVIERHDFGPVLRAREDVGPDDAAAVTERRIAVLAELEGLA